MSGHFRKYQECYPNFEAYLRQPLNSIAAVDVFISTWDKLFPEKSWTKHTPEQSQIDTDVNEIARLYNPVYIIMDNFEQVKPKILLSNFTDKDIKVAGAGIGEDGYLYSTPMHLKITEAFELKNLCECNNGFKYDYVIKYRPDFVLESSFNTSLLNQNVRTMSSDVYPNAIDDVFLCGPDEPMEKIGKIFNKLPTLMNNFNGFVLGPELIMGDLFRMDGIKSEQCSHIGHLHR